MGILPDWMVRSQVQIEPLAPCEERPGRISYGLTSYGYDARAGYRFQVFTPNPIASVVIDPKAFDKRGLVDVDITPQRCDWKEEVCLTDNGRDGWTQWTCLRCGRIVSDEDQDYRKEKDTDCPGIADHIIIPPHSFALAETVEHITIPRDVLCVVVGKSTYARCGIIVPLTPLEPEWRGKVTVEIGNTTPLPAKVYAGEGIMQLLFFRTDGVGDATLNGIRRLLQPGVLYPSPDKEAKPVREIVRGIEELLHHELGRSTCQLSYRDKKGIYNDQPGIVHPTVRPKGKP